MFRISSFSVFLSALVVLLFFARPTHAFGAGNIVSVSSIAGKNWRHGDIEDTLLELFISKAAGTKFDKLAVKRVYFGNWLRDYSQAIDVGGLKMLPKDTIRVLLWVLSFLTFGFATGEFEVTEQRLGCYRPEEHIDNPKDYADNEDARKYDSRLRGPVDEAKELAVDQNTGMKAYIASEGQGFDTSAGLVKDLFRRSIDLGRKYARDGNKNDLYEALRLLGTGLHCLEDFSAHSNYTELVLNELGVDAFPHVGEDTKVNVNGQDVYPIVTGTFGMTDFLHSVVGEVSDKMLQSEVQVLDEKLSKAHEDQEANSHLKAILDQIPFGLLGMGDSDFGGDADKLAQESKKKEEANASQPNQTAENIKSQVGDLMKQIYPIFEFHDKVMKAVSEGISKIPFADTIMEKLTGAMQIYIFSILAPYILPVLKQAKAELATGSEGVLKSSEKAQFNVFSDSNSTDPTHSMLSKDHFTNILNVPAGRIASEVVRYAGQAIAECWDDEHKNVDEVLNDVVRCLHHPALRDQGHRGQSKMYEAVEKWWNELDGNTQDHFREALSREGVKEGKNHDGEDHSGAPGGRTHSHSGCAHSHGAGASYGQYGSGGHGSGGHGSSGRQQDNGAESYGQSSSGYGRRNEDNGAETYGRQTESSGYGQSSSYGRGNEEETSSYGRQNQSSYGRNNEEEESSYARRTEGSGYGQEEETPSYGRRQEETSSDGRDNESSGYGRDNESSGYGQTSSYGRDNESSGYGQTSSYGRGNDDETPSYGRRNNEEEETSSYGRRNEESSSYGRQNESSGYGETSSYGRNNEDESSSYGRRQEESSYGRQEESSYGRQEESSYGPRKNPPMDRGGMTREIMKGSKRQRRWRLSEGC